MVQAWGGSGHPDGGGLQEEGVWTGAGKIQSAETRKGGGHWGTTWAEALG